MNDGNGSITGRIYDLKEGNNVDAAAREIWGRYFEKLVCLARGRLQRSKTRTVGDEDVALSSLDCLFRGLAAGRFPDLAGRDSLLRLLLKITSRKASNRIRDENRLRRGGGVVVNVGALESLDDVAGELLDFAGSEPSPEFAAMFADEYECLLLALPSDEHRQIVSMKMEGLADREIADHLGIGLRTVERKLAVIRASMTCTLST